MQQVTVDLDRLLETALLGARRASVFMALGTNAAEDPTHTSYRLPTAISMSLLPEDVSTENVAEFKREFRVWIVASALRDLIDHFSVYLDQVFEACWLPAHQVPLRQQGLPTPPGCCHGWLGSRHGPPERDRLCREGP
jgi:hypothetical protein